MAAGRVALASATSNEMVAALRRSCRATLDRTEMKAGTRSGALRHTKSVLGVRVAADDRDRRREHEAGRVAAGRARQRSAAPLDADLAQEGRARLDDAGLDRDLRGLGVERDREPRDLLAVAGHVGDDQLVGAL